MHLLRAGARAWKAGIAGTPTVSEGWKSLEEWFEEGLHLGRGWAEWAESHSEEKQSSPPKKIPIRIMIISSQLF